MATQQQFEYFKFKYKEEDERNSLLTRRAEIYLSIISLVFTGLIFNISNLKSLCDRNLLILLVFIPLFASLISAVWFILNSLKLRDYSEDLDVTKYVDELGDHPPEDSDFFDSRIANFIAATATNFKINNQKASQLVSAGIFILLTFIFIAIFLIATLIF